MRTFHHALIWPSGWLKVRLNRLNNWFRKFLKDYVIVVYPWTKRVHTLDHLKQCCVSKVFCCILYVVILMKLFLLVVWRVLFNSRRLNPSVSHTICFELLKKLDVYHSLTFNWPSMSLYCLKISLYWGLSFPAAVFNLC